MEDGTKKRREHLVFEEVRVLQKPEQKSSSGVEDLLR